MVPRTNRTRSNKSTRCPTVPARTMAAPVVQKPKMDGWRVVDGKSWIRNRYEANS